MNYIVLSSFICGRFFIIEYEKCSYIRTFFKGRFLINDYYKNNIEQSNISWDEIEDLDMLNHMEKSLEMEIYVKKKKYGRFILFEY